MKKLLRLLTALSISIPTSITSVACGAAATPATPPKTEKFTAFDKKIINAVVFSSSTAFWLDDNNEAWWYDSAKPKDEQFTDLNKVVAFTFLVSPTTAIVSETVTGNAFFFDASKLSTSGQFTALNKAIDNYFPLTPTVGVFRELATNEGWLFDATKLATTPLVDLGKALNSFWVLSSTKGILKEESTGEAWYFDNLKSFGNKFLDLGKKMTNFYLLTATTGIFTDENKEAFWFDSTKSLPNKFFDLNKIIDDVLVTGYSSGLAIEEITNEFYLFSIFGSTGQEFTDLNRQIGSIFEIHSALFIVTGPVDDNAEVYDGPSNTFFDLNKAVSGVTEFNNEFDFIFENQTNKAFFISNKDYSLIDLEHTSKGVYKLTGSTAIFRDGNDNAFLFQYD